MATFDFCIELVLLPGAVNEFTLKSITIVNYGNRYSFVSHWLWLCKFERVFRQTGSRNMSIFIGCVVLQWQLLTIAKCFSVFVCCLP